MKEQKNVKEEGLEQAVSQAEEFFKKNGKCLLITVAAVVVIAAVWVLCYKYVYQPKVAEAQEQAYHAEANFIAGEYELALNGDGNVLGFEQVIKDYGTKAGKAVYLYAGVCELQLGNYEAAISYLKKYNGKDSILAARALACIGDAQVGLENLSAAIASFEKAAKVSDNVYSAEYLLKAGVCYEELGNDAKALACYQEIKTKYPQSVQGYDIDKYISRIEAK